MADSDPYQRKRRLAYLLVFLCVVFLIIGVYLGFLLEVYRAPRAAAVGNVLHVLHGATKFDDPSPGCIMLALDATMTPRGESRRLVGHARGFLPESGGVTAFFGTRFALLKGGETVRGGELGQAWDVLDAVPIGGDGEAWIFGQSKGGVVARRRAGGEWSEEVRVAETGAIEWLSASSDGDSRLMVAWREKASSLVRTARLDGDRYVPHAEFEIGDVEQWDAVLQGDRTLLIYYYRDDRTYRSMGIRLRCCTECGLKPPPETINFTDPILLLGRKVTGVAGAVMGDRLAVVVTRWTSIQAGTVPLATFEAGAFRTVGGEPAWRHLATLSMPLLILCFSFSLVYLGYTLFRERTRFILETLRPVTKEGPVPAEILQRAMAGILDLIILFPIYFIAVELLSASPETSSLDPEDPKLWAMLGVWLALRFLYYFLCEWLTGRSLGKRLVSIHVARMDGSPIRFRDALFRNLARPLDADFITFILGVGVMASNTRRQRVGDLIASTIVVQDQ